MENELVTKHFEDDRPNRTFIWKDENKQNRGETTILFHMKISIRTINDRFWNRENSIYLRITVRTTS